jgi:phosphoribosylformylglycinamidine synthase
LKVIHGRKTGTPPRCVLEREKALHDALRGWIQSGVVRSAHDCSEGGLAVALAESCISHQIARGTPRLIGAKVDLSSLACPRTDALLFGETQSRVVISVSEPQTGRVLGQAKALGIPAIRLGEVGGETLEIRTPDSGLRWELRELHERWWNAIARAMH